MSKITKQDLREAIDEEIALMIESGEIDEGFLDRLKARASGVGSKVGSTVKSAGQSLGSKVTGAKAAAVGALGGDSADLKQQQAAQQQAAADTKAAGAATADAKKTLSIVNSHLKALVGDLTKLGIDLDTPGVKRAVSALQKSVTGTLGKAAGVQENKKRTHKIITKEE